MRRAPGPISTTCTAACRNGWKTATSIAIRATARAAGPSNARTRRCAGAPRAREAMSRSITRTSGSVSGSPGRSSAMALYYRRQQHRGAPERQDERIEPRLNPVPRRARSDVFDTGRKTIIDCAHVRVERLDTRPVLFSKVFKEFEDGAGRRYDYRYWAERENFFLREFLKKQSEFRHVVQARHLISENEAAKQVLTCDAGITVANWLRVKARYGDTATLSHPFQRSDAFLHLLRASLVALKQIHEHRIVHCDIKEDNI